MTLSERAARLIGRTASLIVPPINPRTGDGDMLVPVEIVDARVAYGRIDVRVKPLAGEGVQWVRLERVMRIK